MNPVKKKKEREKSDSFKRNVSLTTVFVSLFLVTESKRKSARSLANRTGLQSPQGSDC